jgi:Flp pilus assembly protein TadG
MTRPAKIVERFKQAARTMGSDSGSALVEMAISTTLIMSVFLGVFQLAMACYTYNTICEVARESARWAAVRGSTCSTNTPNLNSCGATSANIQAYAKTVGAIDWSQCTTQSPCVSTSWMTATTTGSTQQTTTWAACSSGTCNVPGNLVVVNITYPYGLNLPFLRSYSLSLKATSQMVVSQ